MEHEHPFHHSSEDHPCDLKGNPYKSCLDMGHAGIAWAHLIINEEDWKVFENDTQRIEVILYGEDHDPPARVKISNKQPDGSWLSDEEE